MNKNTNKLGIEISRPSQVLIIMRGIPGAGKSTKAKTLVGDGVIHSTDDIIESYGDYRAFFSSMISSGNFGPLSKAHNQNLNNAISSMKMGITPVVIDNTNIKQNESKAYIVAALEMGFADDNIQFVDIGTSGLDAEVLAERNTHGVPLDKIKQMIASHKGQGSLTLNSVLKSKDMFTKSDVLYSAVVLDDLSKALLFKMVGDKIPNGWLKYGHHMTITLGPLKDKVDIGKTIILTVTDIGLSDMAMAVKVDGYGSKNKTPYITIAINSNGGKPKMSNDITTWVNTSTFDVSGIVTEITK